MWFWGADGQEEWGQNRWGIQVKIGVSSGRLQSPRNEDVQRQLGG